MSRLWALLKVSALLLPLGVLGHVIADVIDTPGPALHALTAAHAALALLAAAGCLLSYRWLRTRRRDLRRQAALLAKRLPGSGGAMTFVLLGALLCAFIVSTQAIEGSLAAVSLVQALIVAAVCAALGVMLVSVLRDVIPSLPDAPRALPRALQRRAAISRWRSHLPYFAFVPVRGNRPPPQR